MLDLDKDVRITAGDRELFKGRLNRTITILARTLAERPDPTSIFSSEQTVKCR